jgi:molecular chaperone GrpE
VYVPARFAGGDALIAEQYDELKAKAAKAEDYWDRLLRTQADLENYRKRAVRERQDAIQSAQATLLGRLLPALDSFDRALEVAQAGEGVLSQLESAEVPEGHVVQQLRKGYRLKERLLRPASVIVAKKPNS